MQAHTRRRRRRHNRTQPTWAQRQQLRRNNEPAPHGSQPICGSKSILCAYFRVRASATCTNVAVGGCGCALCGKCLSAQLRLSAMMSNIKCHSQAHTHMTHKTRTPNRTTAHTHMLERQPDTIYDNRNHASRCVGGSGRSVGRSVGSWR